MTKMRPSRAQRRRSCARHRKHVPYGSKHDGGWWDTRGEGLESARAREKRRALRSITEQSAPLVALEP